MGKSEIPGLFHRLEFLCSCMDALHCLGMLLMGWQICSVAWHDIPELCNWTQVGTVRQSMPPTFIIQGLHPHNLKICHVRANHQKIGLWLLSQYWRTIQPLVDRKRPEGPLKYAFPDLHRLIAKVVMLKDVVHNRVFITLSRLPHVHYMCLVNLLFFIKRTN